MNLKEAKKILNDNGYKVELNEDLRKARDEVKDSVGDALVGGMRKLSPKVQQFIQDTIPLGAALKERFVNVDEIRVPEWLWVAYETGDTSNLDDEEIYILHNFEKYHKNQHLEANEEPNFYNRNDVTDEGGMCYTVQVFEDNYELCGEA